MIFSSDKIFCVCFRPLRKRCILLDSWTLQLNTLTLSTMSTLHLSAWWTWHSDWLNLSLWNILGCTSVNMVWGLGIVNVKETTRSHWSPNHRLQFTSIQRQRFQFWLIDGNIDKWRSPLLDLSMATLSTYCVAPAFTHILLRGNISDRQVLLFVKSFCLLLLWSESDWVACPASVMTHHGQITK